MSESVATAREISHRVLIRVREARLPSVAAALAFTTLLSLVPLMTVGFAILAVFPAFDAWRDQVESLLYTNLIPATSDVVSSYLQEFSGQAGTLTGLG
ncbi:MAG: YihY family inner membrane protein, partial [Proteobacteria bacterium]|nr:YihY family inner membrane protein [Pseudomonadota bacterium]